MGTIVQIPPRTYSAEQFRVRGFLMSGTLDGYIDFATPTGTYSLDLDEVRQLIAALHGVIRDVETNCLYDRDVLLAPRRS